MPDYAAIWTLEAALDAWVPTEQDEQTQGGRKPCAVCYCRGCPQCTNPTPPSEICFCPKAMRPQATKSVPTTGWILWDAEGRWIGSTTSPSDNGWRAVSINDAEAEEWQQRGCILDRMDEAGWRAYNAGDLARWQFDPGSRDVWLKAKGGES